MIAELSDHGARNSEFRRNAQDTGNSEDTKLVTDNVKDDFRSVAVINITRSVWLSIYHDGMAY